MNNWSKVFSSNNIFRAELAKNELLSHEIQAVVLNKKDSNYLLGYCEVYVPNEHLNIANVIIDLFNQKDNLETE